MKATEYRAWLTQHELTHEAAGRALGFNRSTSMRYSDGTLEIPPVVALAIEALEARWRGKRRKTEALAASKAGE